MQSQLAAGVTTTVTTMPFWLQNVGFLVHHFFGVSISQIKLQVCHFAYFCVFWRF